MGDTSYDFGRRFETGKIHSLDGWRAISVAGVLVAHWGLPFIPDGWRVLAGTGGVRFFFVISGFLITWLLLREFHTHGKISLRAFYVRRAYRILPVYLTFLAMAALLSPFSTTGLSTRQWLGALLFSANYVDLPVHFGHLWTLAVEEQFYLLWPAVFSVVNRKDSATSSMGVLLAACMIAPVCRAIHFLMADAVPLALTRFSFFLHMDSIAIGCFAALFLWHRPQGWGWLHHHRHVVFMAALALLLITSPLVGGFHGAIFLKHVFGASAQAAGFALLLVTSLSMERGGVFRILNHRHVATVGVLSYSIYIWHLMFAPGHTGFGFLSNNPMFSLWALYLPLSFAFALTSYHLLEKPFMALRKRHLTHS